jgi:uncharacterized protein (TIGR03437 family)
MRILLFVVAAVTPALAQNAPYVFRGGVVNAASFASNQLPGGGIAQGSIFTIFGRALGPSTGTQVSAFPLGSQLAGVSIAVRKGTTQVAAIPVFVLNSQINAIMPSAAPLGNVSLRVTYNGQNSNWVPVRVVDHAPGIFTATGLGRGGAIFQNYVSASSQPINSGVTAVMPGQVGTLWLTGSGAISGADSDTPPVGNLPYKVEIFVGGRPVTNVLYSGRAPGSSGLDQFVFYVPDDSPGGCYVPVYVRVGGAVSNAATMAVMPQGGACADTHNPISAALFKGGKIVYSLFHRGSVSAGQFAGIDVAVSVDEASARAMEESGSPYAFDPFLSLPPQGACTSYVLSGNILDSGLVMSSAGRALDLGALSANLSGNNVSLKAQQPGLYNSILGGGDATTPLFFSSGTPSLHAAGGADAKSFDVPVPGGATLASAKLDALTSIVRGSSAAISWTAQPAISAMVIGGVYDQASNSSGLFLCVSAPGASSLTVPDYVLANLPASSGLATQGDARLFFSALPALQQTTTPDQLRIFTARQDLTIQAIHSVQ